MESAKFKTADSMALTSLSDRPLYTSTGFLGLRQSKSLHSFKKNSDRREFDKIWLSSSVSSSLSINNLFIKFCSVSCTYVDQA